MCHPNADSYKDLSSKQIRRQQENEKKRMYANRVMEVEQATFTPLVFTTAGGMAEECRRYQLESQSSLLTRKDRRQQGERIAGNKENLHELTEH